MSKKKLMAALAAAAAAGLAAFLHSFGITF